jgi:NAD(P)-dependent dehydrogenase (short-subunit alcohol dehydrogenase family)
MDLELTGKVAVVKGSTSGIGRATALLLFKEGSKGCVNGRSKN